MRTLTKPQSEIELIENNFEEYDTDVSSDSGPILKNNPPGFNIYNKIREDINKDPKKIIIYMIVVYVAFNVITSVIGGFLSIIFVINSAT